MKRYEKNVLRSKGEVEENLVSKSVYLELPIVTAGEVAETLSGYTDKDGNQAIVPPGWTVSGVKKENTIWGKNVSLVIYHIPKEEVNDIEWTDAAEVEHLQRAYDQFVWVPTEKLEPNGTLDRVSFNEKFGRRKYRTIDFLKEKFRDPLPVAYSESVKKYGGFYISRYNISKRFIRDEPQSVKGARPWICNNLKKAIDVARTIIDEVAVGSHLIYGAEYDSVLEWFIESKARTHSEIVEDSTKWGNYTREIAETGSKEEYCTNNIYDFAGNVYERTQEMWDDSHCVIRGGNYRRKESVSHRGNDALYYGNCLIGEAGFRAALYIK